MKRSRTEKNSLVNLRSQSDGVSAAHVNDSLVSHAPTADRIVMLNVGGTIVTTLDSTLRACSSRFTEWLENDFCEFPRDKNGRPFLDRDPNNLRHIINYMRGYGLPSKAEDVVLLAEDAVFFDISMLKEEIGLKSVPKWHFTPGPGVSEDGTHFSTADILSLCGMRPLLLNHTHTVSFRIDKCELISIGLIALDGARRDQQLFRQRQSVSYSNTGEIVRFWGDEPLYDSGTSFKASDFVTVQAQLFNPPCVESSLPLLINTVGTSAPFIEGPNSSLNTTASMQRTSPTRRNIHTEGINIFFSDNSLCPRNTSDSVQPMEGRFDSPQEASQTSSSEWISNKLIGAIITFKVRNKDAFEVRWPAPVPPLQFGVSMQGNSSVSITSSKIRSNNKELTDAESVCLSPRLGPEVRALLIERSA